VPQTPDGNGDGKDADEYQRNEDLKE